LKKEKNIEDQLGSLRKILHGKTMRDSGLHNLEGKDVFSALIKISKG